MRGWAIQTATASTGGSLTEALGIPANDDGGQKVQPGHAKVLTFGGSGTEFALAPDADGILEGVVGLPFVKSDMCAALHVGSEQPVDDEQLRPTRPISRSATASSCCRGYLHGGSATPRVGASCGSPSHGERAWRHPCRRTERKPRRLSAGHD